MHFAIEDASVSERFMVNISSFSLNSSDFKKFLEMYFRVANLSKVGNPVESEITFSQLIDQTFKRFFQSYALAFNK